MSKYEKLESHPETVSNIEPFITNDNWHGRTYPSKIESFEIFEKNSSIFCIVPAYISKINANCEKQMIFSIISNEEKEGWYYFAARKLSALLIVTTSKHHGDFHCLNCFNVFGRKTKLESHQKVCKRKYFCGIALPSKT